MNRDDIIRMAEESGLHIFGLGLDRGKFYFFVEQFFDMAQAAEREACAKVCEDSVEYAGDTLRTYPSKGTSMNREDIIRFGLEANMPYEYDTGRLLYLKNLEKFAALVIQEDRERLAKAIEAFPFGDTASSFARFVREFKPSP